MVIVQSDLWPAMQPRSALWWSYLAPNLRDAAANQNRSTAQRMRDLASRATWATAKMADPEYRDAAVALWNAVRRERAALRPRLVSG